MKIGKEKKIFSPIKSIQFDCSSQMGRDDVVEIHPRHRVKSPAMG